ncbi:MAG: DUF997 family protein [Planctomycetes bacterium]|nr:DUF997 family protein [Planctomycetota bacterium]
MPVTPSTGNVLLRTARREAFWSLVVWGAALVYTVVYCTRYGYDRSIDDLTYVLGFPDWVFYGIVVPWGVCYLISALFAFVIIKDAPLADDVPEALVDRELAAAAETRGNDE